MKIGSTSIISDYRSKIKDSIRKSQKKEGDELTFYEKYEVLRNERNLTNYQVSEETGISQATLSEYKSGKYEPKVDNLKKLANFFGVPLEELIGD